MYIANEPALGSNQMRYYQQPQPSTQYTYQPLPPAQFTYQQPAYQQPAVAYRYATSYAYQQPAYEQVLQYTQPAMQPARGYQQYSTNYSYQPLSYSYQTPVNQSSRGYYYNAQSSNSQQQYRQIPTFPRHQQPNTPVRQQTYVRESPQDRYEHTFRTHPAERQNTNYTHPSRSLPVENVYPNRYTPTPLSKPEISHHSERFQSRMPEAPFKANDEPPKPNTEMRIEGNNMQSQQLTLPPRHQPPVKPEFYGGDKNGFEVDGIGIFPNQYGGEKNYKSIWAYQANSGYNPVKNEKAVQYYMWDNPKLGQINQTALKKALNFENLPFNPSRRAPPAPPSRELPQRAPPPATQSRGLFGRFFKSKQPNSVQRQQPLERPQRIIHRPLVQPWEHKGPAGEVFPDMRLDAAAEGVRRRRGMSPYRKPTQRFGDGFLNTRSDNIVLGWV